MNAKMLFEGGVISLRTCLGLERALGKEAWLTASELRHQADMAEAGDSPWLKGKKTTADLRRASALVNIDEGVNSLWLDLYQGRAALEELIEMDERRIEALQKKADAGEEALQEARSLLQEHINRAQAAEKLLALTNW